MPVAERRRGFLQTKPGLRSGRRSTVAESVYKIIELIGTSTESWEKAAEAAVNKAGESLRELRVAEVSELDMHLQDGKVQHYRAKLKVSFKHAE